MAEEDPVEEVLGDAVTAKPRLREVEDGVAHIPSLGAGPGESYKPDGTPRPKYPTSEAISKDIDDFLYPPMPGSFRVYDIRRKPLDFLKDRYIKVLKATMGIHSAALFYCCWTQDKFEEVLDDDFKKRILQTRAELADRATFIMYKGMGLIGGGDADVAPSVTASMAKVVEKMAESSAQDMVQKKGMRLVVEGLDRNAKHVDPPAAP